MVTLRVLLRRSSDETQEFSLDVQRDGCRLFGEHLRARVPPVDWGELAEYLDDGIAGDDFLGRAGLRRLLEELQAGDAVVCRDHSRLGRDALEVTLVVREIIRQKGGRLFYYSSGQEVTFTNAIDAATTFIQGVGAQMELEAIRARTREALRARVGQGRIAGGKCYGYTNVRQADGSGRAYTIAVVNEAEAKIVREIYDLYLLGYGLARIAGVLNARGVPSPHAGIRGTGSWSTGAIHELLRRERYRGVYVHGQTDRVKQGGKRIARRAPTESILRVVVPEWRIVSEEIWSRTQAAIAERQKLSFRPGPACKYPLSGLARCGFCGGPIGVAHTTRRRRYVPAYVCTYHHKRGKAVCPVAIHQPIEEIDQPILDTVRALVLPEARRARFLADVRARVDSALASRAHIDLARLHAELARLHAEQRRYAKALSTAPNVRELADELRKRGAHVARLRNELALAKIDSDAVRQAVASVARRVDARLEDFYAHLTATPGAARAVNEAVFGRGLVLVPQSAPPDAPPRRGRRRRHVWAIGLVG